MTATKSVKQSRAREIYTPPAALAGSDFYNDWNNNPDMEFGRRMFLIYVADSDKQEADAYIHKGEVEGEGQPSYHVYNKEGEYVQEMYMLSMDIANMEVLQS